MTTVLTLLQEWYFGHCDGDWEHSYYGVRIELREDGWQFQVDLEDLDVAPTAVLEGEVSVLDALVTVGIAGDRFTTSSKSLNAAIGAMFNVEQPGIELFEDPLCSFLDNWCEQYESPQGKVDIGNLSNPGWTITLSLSGTPKEGFLKKVPKAAEGHDWSVLWADGKLIDGACGPLNLIEMLTSMRSALRQE